MSLYKPISSDSFLSKRGPVKFRDFNVETKNNPLTTYRSFNINPTKLTKYRDFNINESVKSTESTPETLTKYRDFNINEVETKQETESKEYTTNKTRLRNKKEEHTKPDSWEFENDKTSGIHYIRIANGIHNFKDCTTFQKKVLYDTSIELNKLYDERDMKRKKDDYKWIQRHPEEYRRYRDLHYMLHSCMFHLDVWDDVCRVYNTGLYNYDDFLDNLKVGDDDVVNRKELKTLRKKLKQIENIEKKKTLTHEEKVKLSKKDMFGLKVKIIEKDVGGM